MYRAYSIGANQIQLEANQTQQAFTLVELLVVVVILSIVATVFVPRFVNFQDDAELQRVRAEAAAFSSAVKLVQLTFQSQGHTVRVQNLANFGAGNVDTNNIGFPIGITKGNGNENIGVGNAGCQGVWEGILEVSSTASTGATTTYQTYRHTSNRVCSYVYREGGDSAGRNSALLVIQYDSRDGRVYVCGTMSGLGACPF